MGSGVSLKILNVPRNFNAVLCAPLGAPHAGTAAAAVLSPAFCSLYQARGTTMQHGNSIVSSPLLPSHFTIPRRS